MFETTKTKEEIKNEIESRNNLKIISVTNSSIIGSFQILIMNYAKKLGFHTCGLCNLNENNDFNGFH